MKIIKKLVSFISAIIFIMCLALMAVVLVTPKDANGTKLVNVAGYSVMTVLTGSMEPDYNVGDIVIVKKTDTDELKVKDVITFYSQEDNMKGQIVTHRIIDITEENGRRLFETKGDNNQIADVEKTAENDVIGKVEGKIPYVGKAATFLQTNRLAFFLIVILPMLVIMAFEVKDIILIARSGDEDESEENNQ